MATIREAELPGIGKKYQLNLEDGEQVVVIRRSFFMRCLKEFPGSSEKEGIPPLSKQLFNQTVTLHQKLR